MGKAELKNLKMEKNWDYKYLKFNILEIFLNSRIVKFISEGLLEGSSEINKNNISN